jgi:hypothetical protein
MVVGDAAPDRDRRGDAVQTNPFFAIRLEEPLDMPPRGIVGRGSRAKCGEPRNATDGVPLPGGSQIAVESSVVKIVSGTRPHGQKRAASKAGSSDAVVTTLKYEEQPRRSATVAVFGTGSSD